MTLSTATAFLLVTATVIGSAMAAENLPINLGADGPPACASQTKARMHSDVIKLAESQSPGAAWRLVQVFLCGSRATALQAIEPILADHVMRKVASPTVVEMSPLSNAKEELGRMLPTGKARNPNVRMEDGSMVVYYSIDAYCWNFFGIRYMNGRWKLDLLGGGCD